MRLGSGFGVEGVSGGLDVVGGGCLDQLCPPGTSTLSTFTLKEYSLMFDMGL
jgi:hypothetical protein